MHSHQASCLRGPISRSRKRWSSAADSCDPPGSERLAGVPAPASSSNDVPSLTDPDIRRDLVERVRRQIAEGTYDTPEKWQAALDKLLNELE
jgi:hypothetical protein